MANPIIGKIKCPHCGNPGATVHKQNKAGNKLYYRCYQSEGGLSPVCGTVQITGPKGQEWIKSNMQPLGQQTPIAEPEPKPEPKPVQQTPIAEPKKQAVGGFLSSFLRDDEE